MYLHYAGQRLTFRVPEWSSGPDWFRWHIVPVCLLSLFKFRSRTWSMMTGKETLLVLPCNSQTYWQAMAACIIVCNHICVNVCIIYASLHHVCVVVGRVIGFARVQLLVARNRTSHGNVWHSNDDDEKQGWTSQIMPFLLFRLLNYISAGYPCPGLYSRLWRLYVCLILRVFTASYCQATGVCRGLHACVFLHE